MGHPRGVWNAVHLDLASKHFGPLIRSQYPNPGPDIERRMIAARAGAADACPEETACGFGLCDEYNLAMIRTKHELLTPEERRETGISSERGHIGIDQLSYAAAARVLREHPEAIGSCRCGDGDNG